MKKRSPGLTLMLIAAALVMVWAVWQIHDVGENLQYVVDAPELVYNKSDREHGTAITDLQEDLEEAAAQWSASIRAWTLGGVIQKITFTGGDKGASGRLELLGENAFATHPRFLLHGRLFYDEELSRGDRVIILDEQLALALFAAADPIDRIVTIKQEEYRVVGVTRHAKQTGDFTDYGAYIPLNSVLEQTIQLDALVVEALPITGAGAGVAFAETVTAWRAGGTVIDLGKESMAASLWLRALLFLVGAAGAMRFLGWLNGRVRRFSIQYKEMLRVTYASRLFPGLLGGVLAFALGYGVLAIVLALLMNYAIQPVYTFPEWIPTVLVEWSDIAAAFWRVWQTPATVLEYRTPELLRLRFMTLVVQVSAALAGAAVAMWFGRTRASRYSIVESLRMLADSGAAVSFLQTDNPAECAAIGYVPCQTKGGMLRVLNAQQALLQMPGTAREGSFAIAVEDPWIPANNATFRIICREKGNTVARTGDPYDIKVPVQTLTTLLYGRENFAEYLESHADFELRMRSPAMEGFFSHHLRVEGSAE